MLAELRAVLAHDRSGFRADAVPRQEVTVVAAGEEACLLALGARGGGEPGGPRLGAHLLLRALAERDLDPVEEPRVEAREHVRLVLARVDAARQEQATAAVDDAGVVAGSQPSRAGPPREGKQLGEPEAAVAPDARVRRLAARVAANERRHDCTPELLAQVERHVRQPERVAELPRRDDGRRRAARPLGVRPVGIEPEPERDADRVRAGAEKRDRAVDSAAHRDRHAPGRRRGAEDGRDRVRERVDGERLAADGRRPEQR